MARKLTKEELEQRAAQRKEYVEASTGTLKSYMMMIGDGFASKMNLLSQLLNGVHHLSEGTYKERLLLTAIRQFLPKRFEVGIGFVLFPLNGYYIEGDEAVLSVSKHTMSHQLDLIVYDSHLFPTIFQDGDFVVVRPEAVRSLIEVKGFAKVTDITSTLEKFKDFGEKWAECKECYAAHQVPLNNDPSLFAMCWDAYVPEGGRPAIDGPRLRDTISAYYRAQADVVDDPDSRPLIRAAYLYNDSIVAADRQLDDDGASVKYGYSWEHGTFRAGRTGDKTVADLFERVQVSLGDRFNSALSVVLRNQELEDEVPDDDDVRHGFDEFASRPI